MREERREEGREKKEERMCVRDHLLDVTPLNS